jgi:hypothetical protein
VTNIDSVVIYCRDPYVMGPFWSVVTGLPIHPEDEAAIEARSLGPDESVLLGRKDDGTLHVWIAQAEELLPVGRIHLDIRGDREAILAAGAKVVREQEHWTVMTDPEGNEFCLVRATP